MHKEHTYIYNNTKYNVGTKWNYVDSKTVLIDNAHVHTTKIDKDIEYSQILGKQIKDFN